MGSQVQGPAEGPCEAGKGVILTEPREIGGATMILRPLHQGIGQVSSLAWSPDGNSLAVGFTTGFVLIWDTTRGDAEPRCLHAMRGSCARSLDWAPDCGALAAASDSGELYFFA